MTGEILTTYQIAILCDVDIATVTNWIDAGKLSAYRTPGGHRRIYGKDFVKFLEKYEMPIPEQFKRKKHSILVVDDEKIIVEVVSRALMKAPWKLHIDTAYDGFEAGVKLTSKLPSLVILDINLPGVDGYKILKNIRSTKELKNIKVLAISGRDLVESRNGMLANGADSFLPKPLDLHELTQTVGKLLKLT